MAHALSYTAPLPWLDSIELFRVYAQSTPRLPDTYGQTGISAQMSLRYDWRLPTINDTTQMAQFGYHFKRSSNDLEFGGFQVFNSNDRGLLAAIGAGARFRWSGFVDFRCTYRAPFRAATPNGSKAPTVLLFMSVGT
jgi:hypothetical protein